MSSRTTFYRLNNLLKERIKMNGINQIRDKCATFRLLDKLMVEFLLGGLMPCVSSVLAVAEVQFSNLLILKLVLS